MHAVIKASTSAHERAYRPTAMVAEDVRSLQFVNAQLSSSGKWQRRSVARIVCGQHEKRPPGRLAQPASSEQTPQEEAQHTSLERRPCAQTPDARIGGVEAVAVRVYNREEAKAAAEMAVARAAVKAKATSLFSIELWRWASTQGSMRTRSASPNQTTKRSAKAQAEATPSRWSLCWLFPSRKSDCRGERRENQLVGCSVATS